MFSFSKVTKFLRITWKKSQINRSETWQYFSVFWCLNIGKYALIFISKIRLERIQWNFDPKCIVKYLLIFVQNNVFYFKEKIGRIFLVYLLFLENIIFNMEKITVHTLNPFCTIIKSRLTYNSYRIITNIDWENFRNFQKYFLQS